MSDPKPTGPHTKLSTILIPTYPVKILQSRCTERAASQHTPCRTRSTPSRTPSSLPPTQPPQDTQPQKGAGPPLTKSSSPPPPTTKDPQPQKRAAPPTEPLTTPRDTQPQKGAAPPPYSPPPTSLKDPQSDHLALGPSNSFIGVFEFISGTISSGFRVSETDSSSCWAP